MWVRSVVGRTGLLEVLGQALVEPQREVGQGVVDQSVCAFVAEVNGPGVMLEGEDVSSVCSLQVQSSPPSGTGQSLADVLLIAAAVGQQVYVDRLPGDGQAEPLVELCGECFE